MEVNKKVKICCIETASINNVLYVYRPEVTEELYANFVSKFAAVPNSEYEKLVVRIANLILFCGENLTEKYEMFFSEEYNEFSVFLELEQGIDELLIEEILVHSNEYESLWRIDITDFETYNFMNLFDGKTWEEEPLVDKINLVLVGC